MIDKLSISFIDSFDELGDPRIETHSKRHNLMNILAITILGVICGADNWIEIEAFGKSKKGWLENFLELPNEIPSHDTFAEYFPC